MVSNLICISNNDLTIKTLDGCNFVVVEPKDELASVNPKSTGKLIRVSSPDENVDLKHAAGIVIPASSSFAAVKNWKLKNPTKLLIVELHNDTQAADAFMNGLWKQGGNFLDIIMSKYPIQLGKEPNDVPTMPPHKLAMFADRQQAYKTSVNFAETDTPKRLQMPATDATLPAAHFPVWGWVLVGMGILAVVGVITWLALTYSKKRQRLNYSNETVP
jgi:hypothetical protein